MKFKHLKSCIAFALMKFPMKGQWRIAFAKLGGVNFASKRVFIGNGVQFDTLYPENITIGDRVHITTGCILLTHYLDTRFDGVHWERGTIEIGERSFIGTRTIICGKRVKIGRNCIVGAGSVVTKDIPDNEIWGGNPARFLKRREKDDRT